MPAASTVIRSPRWGSSAKSSRRCTFADLFVVGLQGLPGRDASVSGLRTRCGVRCSGVAMLRIAFVWFNGLPASCSAALLEAITAISSFHDLTNDSAPSSWSWAASASMSMPALANCGQHCFAVAAVGRQIAGPTSP